MKNMFSNFDILNIEKIRIVQEILGPHRFRDVRKAISYNFALLSSKLLRGAPRNDEKTVLNLYRVGFSQFYL